MKQSIDDFEKMRDDIAKAINYAAYRYVDNRFQTVEDSVSLEEIWEELAPEEKNMRRLQAGAAILIMSTYASSSTQDIFDIVSKRLGGERNE